jgi:hypothetical protein
MLEQERLRLIKQKEAGVMYGALFPHDHRGRRPAHPHEAPALLDALLAANSDVKGKGRARSAVCVACTTTNSTTTSTTASCLSASALLSEHP